MTASAMLYCVSIATLIGLGALAFERIVDVLGRPRRTVWIAAMLASVLFPILVLVGRSPESAAARFASPNGVVEANPITGDDSTALDDVAYFDTVQLIDSSRLDTLLSSAWIASSSALVAFVVIGWLQLRRQARRWPTATFNNLPIRISADTGPAAFGLIRPEIVVPRWLLSTSRTTQSMALAHERSHVVARDPLLSFVGFLLCACTPWNLPLWFQWRRLRFAIEVDCDRRVIREVADPIDYGKSLFEIGLRHSSTPIGVIAMIQQKSHLERRLRIMLAAPASKPLLIVAAAATVAFSFAAIAAHVDAPKLRDNSIATDNTEDTVSAQFLTRYPLPAASSIVSAPAVDQLEPRLRIAATAEKSQSTKKLSRVPIAAQLAAPMGESLNVPAAETQDTMPDSEAGLKRTRFVAPVIPSPIPEVSGPVRVDVAFTVGLNGLVEEAHEVDSKSGVLIDAAVNAVRQWEFEPPLKNGVPTTTRGRIRILMTFPTEAAKAAANDIKNGVICTNGPHLDTALKEKRCTTAIQRHTARNLLLIVGGGVGDGGFGVP